MSQKLPKQQKQNIDSEYLRNKLKLKNLQEKNNLAKKHPHAIKFLADKKIDLSKIREHSAKILSAGALLSTFLLSPATTAVLAPAQEIVDKAPATSANPQQILISDLKTILPVKTQPLSISQEKKLEIFFKDILDVPAKATLEGEHLNTTYGLIGAEQHLRRYPGDTIEDHGNGSILKEGMAPGLGAWGYFASSKAKLTPDLVENEKWYVVVQTLYLSDWTKRLAYLRDWYKYRKVLVVNTLNGNAVVGDIADSGPAAWTGKSFGGSPEVMDSLGGLRYKVGPVILFFVDDPNNKIPLGPVDYNNTNQYVKNFLRSSN